MQKMGVFSIAPGDGNGIKRWNYHQEHFSLLLCRTFYQLELTNPTLGLGRTEQDLGRR